VYVCVCVGGMVESVCVCMCRRDGRVCGGEMLECVCGMVWYVCYAYV